jgi:hypothetical protein
MIDLASADGALRTAGLVVLGLSVLLLLLGLARGRKGLSALRWAAALAPWALVLSAGWQVYLWRVRFDPETGFLGLENVRVLVENAVGAVVLGMIYGLYLRWLWGLTFGGPAGNSTSQGA